METPKTPEQTPDKTPAPALPVIDDLFPKELLVDLNAEVAESLGDAYDCIRAWSAWGCGTMSSQDFLLVADAEDRLIDIRDSVLKGLLKAGYQIIPPTTKA